MLMTPCCVMGLGFTLALSASYLHVEGRKMCITFQIKWVSQRQACKHLPTKGCSSLVHNILKEAKKKAWHNG